MNRTLDNPDNQQQILVDICKTWNINVFNSISLLKAWHQAGRPLLKKFIPYAYHIVRVNTLFQVGLQCDLISTRPTNKVDLEYLYYLPFCHVFTSNDNLHINLAPLLLRKDQYFIKGTDLKSDLRHINDQLSTMSDDEKEKFKKAPPINQSSFTFQRYQEFFDYPNGWQWKINSTEQERSEALKTMKSFEKANEGPAVEMKNGDDGTFVTRFTYMGKNDPCMCGSGKKLTECCLTEEQFDKALKAQAAADSEKRIKVGSAEYLGERHK